MKMICAIRVVVTSVFLLSLAVCPAVAQVELGKKTDLSGGGLGDKTKKVPINARVLQVLPEGLLFSGKSAPYLLVGYPKHQEVADGNVVNVYAQSTGKTFKYEDTTGAVRTVRVFRYLNQRIGGR